MTDIQPLPVEEAQQLYLEARRDELSKRTLRSHRYRTNHLVRYCEDHGYDTGDLDGRTLLQFRTWRRDDGDLNTVSLHTQLSTIRVFLRWLATIDAVDPTLPNKVQVPSLDEHDEQRDRSLDAERAREILSYLSKFEYASFRHTLMVLLWRTGMRVGACRGLNIGDFHPEDQTLHVVHRPDQDCPLKKGTNGERIVSLQSQTVQILRDYLDHTRPPVPDDRDTDRASLLSTVQGRGRPGTSTLRKHVDAATQPCLYGGCPHDRDPESCADQGYSDTYQCPSSRSPHDVRRGSITRFLNEDVPPRAVKDRCDVTSYAMEKHYDVRTEQEKADLRREYFEDT